MPKIKTKGLPARFAVLVSHAASELFPGYFAVVMYLFFISVTPRSHKPTLDTGSNGAWLLAAVSTQSVAILTALVPWNGPEDLRLFFALCMFMVGCMLYLAIITLIFYRLTFLKLSAETLSPPYWINMGAVTIATLTGSTLIIRGGAGQPAGGLPAVPARVHPVLLVDCQLVDTTVDWPDPLAACDTASPAQL